MSRKKIDTRTRGGITSGIEKDSLVLKTVAYIWHQLPKWRDDPNRPMEQSENKLNLQLVKFLDVHARSEFPMVRFDHEEYQYGRRTVDVAASPVEPITIDAKLHTIYDPILVIEGKRLPAPSFDREKEYVSSGKDDVSGGIQRFKLGLHGADLNTVAMIGYVQKGPLVYWYNQVNEWIAKFASGLIQDSCNWSEGDKIEPLEEDLQMGAARSRSDHSRSVRLKSKRIAIYHLWIDMNRRVRAKQSTDRDSVDNI